nr:hypothetical protein [uncultured Parabacteroides sp.]
MVLSKHLSVYNNESIVMLSWYTMYIYI